MMTLVALISCIIRLGNSKGTCINIVMSTGTHPGKEPQAKEVMVALPEAGRAAKILQERLSGNLKTQFIDTYSVLRI